MQTLYDWAVINARDVSNVTAPKAKASEVFPFYGVSGTTGKRSQCTGKKIAWYKEWVSDGGPGEL